MLARQRSLITRRRLGGPGAFREATTVDSSVADVMTRDVAAVRTTARYKDIVAVMTHHGVSGLPVLDSADHLVGVVSEADLLLKEAMQEQPASGHAAWSRHRQEREKAAGLTAADLMSAPAVTIGPQDGVAAAAKRMRDHHLKRLPVVDDAGELVGIVSRVDVLSVYERTDEEIRDEIVETVIRADFALDPAAFNVIVRAGIVTVSGQVASHPLAAHLIDAVRHVEGVVGVRDRVTFPLPEQPEAAVFLRPRPPG